MLSSIFDNSSFVKWFNLLKQYIKNKMVNLQSIEYIGLFSEEIRIHMIICLLWTPIAEDFMKGYLYKDIFCEKY